MSDKGPSSVEVGQHAPDFTLPNVQGGILTLSQVLAQKKVMLCFFPMAFTPG
ncbi:MAG: redoxin domain-containing protein [Chloroflexi bacterium]|nr:redoxin domain-containing protein [Chloroflexota bacterium]